MFDTPLLCSSASVEQDKNTCFFKVNCTSTMSALVRVCVRVCLGICLNYECLGGGLRGLCPEWVSEVIWNENVGCWGGGGVWYSGLPNKEMDKPSLIKREEEEKKESTGSEVISALVSF